MLSSQASIAGEQHTAVEELSSFAYRSKKQGGAVGGIGQGDNMQSRKSWRIAQQR
jgi:hypothetical protein